MFGFGFLPLALGFGLGARIKLSKFRFLAILDALMQCKLCIIDYIFNLRYIEEDKHDI